MSRYSTKLLGAAALTLAMMSGSAIAETRSDFINNPDAYGVITMNQNDVTAYDIPIHKSLLGAHIGAMPVAANGRIYATSIAYYTVYPVADERPILGMAHSPYAR